MLGQTPKYGQSIAVSYTRPSIKVQHLIVKAAGFETVTITISRSTIRSLEMYRGVLNRAFPALNQNVQIVFVSAFPFVVYSLTLLPASNGL